MIGIVENYKEQEQENSEAEKGENSEEIIKEQVMFDDKLQEFAEYILPQETSDPDKESIYQDAWAKLVSTLCEEGQFLTIDKLEKVLSIILKHSKNLKNWLLYSVLLSDRDIACREYMTNILE